MLRVYTQLYLMGATVRVMLFDLEAKLSAAQLDTVLMSWITDFMMCCP